MFFGRAIIPIENKYCKGEFASLTPVQYLFSMELKYLPKKQQGLVL